MRVALSSSIFLAFLPVAVASSSDSQGAIFWDRLRPLFSSEERERTPGEEPRHGLVITVCVLLSFVFWLTLTLGETRTQTLRFPVEVATTPEGQALAEVPPSRVRVRVEGPGHELLRLFYTPPVVEVDGSTGTVKVMEAIDLSQRGSVQIESVSPSSFEIKLEPLTTRTVPVQNRVDIQLASAYELIGEPELEPDSLEVRGAQSVVNGIEAWPTDSSTIENLQDTVKVQVPLADTLSRLVETSTREVTLIARAGRFAEETREVTVEVTGVPSGQDLVALEPSSVRIRYRVLFKQLFEARRSSEFFATVSYDQIRSDTTGYVEPRIHVPSDLVIRDPESIPPRLRYYTFLSGN